MFALHHRSGFASGRAACLSTRTAATRVARLAQDMPISRRIGSFAMIVVAAVRQRAFDLFFTTRRDRERAGLGLHVIFNIVARSLGGPLAADSASGPGTTFRITIPRHATAAAAATE